ncbi:MAG: hemagglutinin repeat-containing protein [Burkholderia sp.]|jgi:filamentous hemagglutinin|uniref:hemagglutinin repeat-containing protein n=1 Tax=Burkholderia sp. TaxID=36773 RepID=UPI002839C858|nr:hemagglutinin repeat-containing protein [Burkholderia sp.]MDR0244135.1 hemagglutinin repeat-containing protein [Burkholderia sp.]
MNKKTYRLVYSRLRGMVVAVEETAAATGKTESGESRAGRRSLGGSGLLIAVASLAVAPSLGSAQIAPTPGTSTHVIQTQNGLPQVNIAKPSGAGVSVNTYNQFDVQKNGAILNNSPTIVNTQQAGYINGNPNFGPGQSARIIVNQVNSANPSQLRGYVEVAGSRAEVVLANPSGIVVDGGGFINTSRATLTTGQPYYGPNGSLVGYNVNRGLIAVQGAGLNAANVDQVDLISRAVQANAAIHAKNLNVVAGASQVNHDTLATTPIQGDGAAPAVSIDVGQLGGMYGDRIYLVGTEGGVGVRNAGTIAAQAGDMTLQSNGRLVLTGKTTASGNLAMSAAGGIENGGTVYARQSLLASTTADLTNDGTLAAQQNVTVKAGSVQSTGTLGAGVDDDGVVGRSGDLNIEASEQLTATGQNLAGGNASLTGGSVNLAGSRTAANSGLSLSATAGDLNLSDATTSGVGALTANATGALINDRGNLSSDGGVTLTAGGVSNQGGKVSTQGSLSVQSSGQIANQSGTLVSHGAMQVHGGAIANNRGTLQSTAGLTVAGASLDNTAGRIVSLGGDGLSVTTTGQLTNAAGKTAVGAQGGVIGSNGDVALQAGQFVNRGTVTAQQNLRMTSQLLDNGNGTLSAGRNADIDGGAVLTNASGSITAGQAATIAATSLDNSSGSINATQLMLTADDLANRGGSIAQTGTGAMRAAVSGTFDNTGGTLQTNSADLSLSPTTLINDHGKIAHAGNGTLSIATGSLSNNAGQIATNGALAIQAAALSNQAGTLSAQRNASLAVQSLDNRAGGHVGADNVVLTAQGRLDNGSGAIEASNGLTISADSIANDAGSIKNIGTSDLSVTSKNALSNIAGGTIGGNGSMSVVAGSIDNSSGSLLSARALAIQSNGALTNTSGLIRANGDLGIHARGAVGNTGGQIEANGATSTLSLSGSSVDNSNGRIVNIGTGATTIAGGASITNGNATGKDGAGVIGGNGDVTLSTQSLANTSGGQILAGRDLVLDVANRLDNSNGVLSAASNAKLNDAMATLVNRQGSIRANGVLALTAASIDNTNGKIGNDAGSGGSVLLKSGALANQGGAIGSDQDLSLTAGSLSGDGSIVAGRNGTVSLASDYTHTAANRLHANGDLTLTTSGKLTNQGKLDANGALTVNAANVDNQAGADLNSTNTTVNADGGTIDNAGRIEGETVTTNSNTLNNTAAIIGRDVTLNAGTISNAGAAAVIAAANRANLYASNRLSNTGGASIFSVGDINIAASGQRDTNGYLSNRTQTVLNDQSSIEALGSVELAAETFTNTRPAPTVETDTTGVDTKHETKRSKYIGCPTGNAAPNHGVCSYNTWVGPYKTPLQATYSSAQVISSGSGDKAVDRVLVVNINGQAQTIYYNTLTDNGNGTFTAAYWDGYDPHVNYDPASEYATRSDGHNGYQRVEIARDTTTTIQQDKVTSQAQQAQLVAGGNIVMKNVGTINNAFSAISAGRSIKIGDADVSGSAGSGGYGGTTVNNVGQTLYRYQRDDIVSTYAWNENTNSDVGKIAQPSKVYTPVAIGNTGGTIVANQSIDIDAKDVNNRNVAAESSATGATGGTLGANQWNDGVTGNGQPKVGMAAGQKPVDALQSVVSPTGALPNLKLPTSGLYTINPAPGQPYLIATDPRLTSYTNFISSDYMLGQLNLNPASIEKRLGDGMYEQQMVRNQITQLTGRTFLPGYASAEDEYRALMTSGANYAKQFGMVPGMALSAAQMDALTSDVVWLVSQTVTLPDGSTTQVLAPVVYLAKTHANDLQPTGALIAADDIEIRAAGSTTNSGVIKGGSKTVVAATDILNRGGTIASSSENGTTVVSASNDVVNASGQITGNRVAVLAGRDVVNTTLVDTVGVSSAAGGSRVGQSLVGRQGTIASTGDLAVQAGRDVSIHGANLSAGGGALVTAERDIRVDTVQSKTDQSLYLNDQHHWEESTTTHVTSGVGAGGNLKMQSGSDTSLEGATVTAGKDLSAIAGGNLTATTVTNEHQLNNVAVDGRSRKEVDRTYDQQAVGTSFSAGQNATLGAVNRADATKGNVVLTGSSVMAGANAATPGRVTIAASRDVTIGEAREQHDDYRNVQVKRGSFVSGTATKESHDTRANIGVASTVSGDTVQVQAGRDLAVQGSNVVGTNDVKLGAANNVAIRTSQDIVQSASSYEKKESGLMSNGGLSVSVGTRSMSDQQHSTEVANTGSMIGSLNGNLTVAAGSDLHVTGSALHAGNDANLVGKTVRIDSATDTANFAEQQQFRQSGLTVGVTNPVVSAVQTGRQMANAAQSVGGDPRLLALAAATTGLAAKNTYDAVKSVGGNPVAAAASVGVNVSVGASKSDSHTQAQSSTAVGSSVSAGRNVTVAAAGAGKESNIDVIGSTISAGNDARLAADGDVSLQAAQNTSSQHSTNSGSSASVGVTLTVGAKNGLALTAGVAGNRGNADGDSSTSKNTHVTAGNQLTIQSGGDTNLKGAVASGKQVVADVGGNLNIESLQDKDRYDSKQQNAGVSVSVCPPPCVSSVAGNVGQAKMSSDYASVVEQSGIKAGDGGFQVGVKGNTDLKGGVIASNDKAVSDGVNTLTTATLTHRDIENHASYDASQVALSGGVGFGGESSKSGIGKDQKGKADNVNPVAGTELPKGDGGLSIAPPVALNASGDANSTTRSGISGGALTIRDDSRQQQLTGQSAAETVASINRDTSDTGGVLAPIFDKEKIQAGFDITSQFINQVGTFVDNRVKETDAAQKALDKEKAKPAEQQDSVKIAQLTQTVQSNATWQVGGTGRQVLTVLTAAVGGNVTGSAGTVMRSAAAYYLQSLAAEQVKGVADALDSELARTALQSLVGCAAAAASSAGCGAGAAGAAASVVLNNLLDSVNSTQASTLTNEEKLARERIVQTIVAATTSALGGDAAAASIASLIETENNAANFVRGTTPRMQTAATSVADVLRKPKGALTRADVDAQIAALNALEGSGNLSNQEALNLSSLWMALVERASAENLMTPLEVIGSKQAMQAAIASMMFSGGGDSAVRLTGSTARPELPRTTGNRVNATNIKIGGAVELFTDSSGPKIPGAIGVGPTDGTAIAKDARNMPNIPSNSQATVVANNPFIPRSAGGTNSMMDFLPEAARITTAGGSVVINGNGANPYFSKIPSAEQLDALGLTVKYQGKLLPEYQGLNFSRSDGSPIQNDTMRTIVFVKKQGE